MGTGCGGGVGEGGGRVRVREGVPHHTPTSCLSFSDPPVRFVVLSLLHVRLYHLYHLLFLSFFLSFFLLSEISRLPCGTFLPLSTMVLTMQSRSTTEAAC